MTDVKNDAPGRAYGGRCKEDRVAERRAKLLEAAARIYLRDGPQAASVAAICAEAGLTTRYFYESFASNDALTCTIFEEMCRRMIGFMEEAAAKDGPPAALRTFLFELTDHPGMAKVFLADLDRHSPELRVIGRRFVTRIGEIAMPGLTDPLIQAGAIGAILWTARAWVESGYAEASEDVLAAMERFTSATH